MNGVKTRDLSRPFEDARVAVRVADDEVVGVGKGGNVDAEGVGVDAAPCHAGAIVRHRDAVMVPSSDARHVSVAMQPVDGMRTQDVGKVFPVTFIDARLAVIVQSPAIDGTVFLDGKGVIRPNANVDDALAQAKSRRDESALWEARVDAAAQLALIAESPGEHATIVIEG